MKPLLVRITVTDGQILTFKATLFEANTAFRDAFTDGFRDDATGRFHPSYTIETIEVEDTESASGRENPFSEN